MKAEKPVDPLVARYLAKGRRARNTWWPDYVFIHINKTAGSSIERALALRFEHMTALEKRAQLGWVRWQRAFKFAFIRNPWSRALSHYHFRVQTNQTGLGDRHLSFRDWARAVFQDRDPRYRDQELMFQTQWHWLSDEADRCLVDYIGRFETLQADFASLSRILGTSSPLPHLKQSAASSPSNFYDEDTRKIVASYYSIDIEKFNYQFPSASDRASCAGPIPADYFARESTG